MHDDVKPYRSGGKLVIEIEGPFPENDYSSARYLACLFGWRFKYWRIGGGNTVESAVRDYCDQTYRDYDEVVRTFAFTFPGGELPEGYTRATFPTRRTPAIQFSPVQEIT